MPNDDGTSIEVAEARREVDLARASLRHRVHVASETGKRIVDRAVGNATPVLILAGLGVLALGVGLYKLMRPRRARTAWRPPERRSLIREVIRSALISAAARLASAAVSRIPVPQLRADNS